MLLGQGMLLNMTMGQIVDLVIIVLATVLFVIGFFKGLFSMVFKLISFVAAFLIGKGLANSFDEQVTDWIYPAFQEKLFAVVTEKVGDISFLNPEKLEETLKGCMVPVVNVLLIIIFTIIAAIILSICRKAFDAAIKKSKGITFIDRVLGGVLDVIIMALICYVIVFGINKINLAEYMKNTVLPDSWVFNLMQGLIPSDTSKFAIVIPSIGEINLDVIIRGLFKW